MKIFKKIILPLFISIILVLMSILLTFSYRFMGFEFGSELLSYLNQEFIYKILIVYSKIVIIQYIYFSTISEFINIINPSKNIKTKYILYSYLLFIVLPFLSSLIMHPQLYGDFFYLKHPYFQFILNFFTTYSNPFIYVYLIYLLLIIFLIYIIVKSFLSNDSIYTVTYVYFSMFILFHLKGEIVGLLICYIIYKILSYKSYNINKIYNSIVLFLICCFCAFIYYNENRFIALKTKNEKPPIFIISADSLRKDKVGLIRNGSSITPNIDKFSIDAFKFMDHNTTIPRTFPSWTDLLTGKYSMEHKIRDMFPAPEEADNIGSDKFPTIGTVLLENGYETSVFSNFAGDIFPRANFGFKITETANFNAEVILIQKILETQIFLLPILTGTLGGGEYFQEINSFSNLGDGKFILNKIKPYLRQKKSSNIFMTVFFSVTHFPYSPPYPYYKLYSDPQYDGKYKFLKFVDPTDDSKPSEKDINQIRDLFDESVTAFDDNFGELINVLKETGLYDDSIIILTSDHGESIYENIHGHGHGEHLRGENVLGIPLIIKFPDIYTKSLFQECDSNKSKNCNIFNDITSSVDIFPTIMDFLKIPLNNEYPGKSLLTVLGKENWNNDRFVYAETGIWFSDIGEHFFQKQRIYYPSILKLHRIVPERGNQIMITDNFYRNSIAFGKHRAILSKNYKFIYIPTHDGVIYELYDRINDPLNTLNLFPQKNIEIYKNELYNISKKWENSKVISEYIFPPPIEND